MSRRVGDWRDWDHASEVQRALHQGARPATRLFLLAVAALFAALVFWASRAFVDEVTRGEGRVVPSSQIQVVQTLEGGIVKEILVHEGDEVAPGEVLLRIDDTGFSSSLGELAARRTHLRAAIARLEAEVAGAGAIAFPADLEDADPAIAAAEERLFQARAAALANQVSILRRQAEQREQELAELRGTEANYLASLELAREELAIFEPLVRNGVVPQVDVLRTRREVNDLEGRLDSTRQAMPRAETAIREAEERIDDQGLTARSAALAELGERRAELAVIEESLRAARDRVVRTDLRSPVRGIVNAMHVATLGGVVQPGRDLVEIVPIEDTLLVEARIRPSDVAFIRPGQAATVKITAYDYAIYGGLAGEVERIGADTIANEETGESFYQIAVRTRESRLGTEAAPLPIIPGMVASVDILTGRKTVLDYLLKPILKARDEALRER